MNWKLGYCVNVEWKMLSYACSIRSYIYLSEGKKSFLLKK
jgi:hypothetical protein